jgi:hypothetical protein
VIAALGPLRHDAFQIDLAAVAPQRLAIAADVLAQRDRRALLLRGDQLG